MSFALRKEIQWGIVFKIYEMIEYDIKNKIGEAILLAADVYFTETPEKFLWNAHVICDGNKEYKSGVNVMKSAIGPLTKEEGESIATAIADNLSLLEIKSEPDCMR